METCSRLGLGLRHRASIQQQHIGRCQIGTQNVFREIKSKYRNSNRKLLAPDLFNWIKAIESQIGAGDLHLGSEGLQVSGLKVYGSWAFESAS